ncbi:MAG: hypothetical protein Q8L98_07910, partial [Chlamydiales bacterium]|nr:hypothetical protein [Chlamydiales bacterium]
LNLHLHLQQQEQQQQQLPPTGQMFRVQSGFSDVADSDSTFVLEPSTAAGQSLGSLITLLAPSGLNCVGPSGTEAYPSPSKLLQQLDDSLVQSTSSSSR